LENKTTIHWAFESFHSLFLSLKEKIKQLVDIPTFMLIKCFLLVQRRNIYVRKWVTAQFHQEAASQQPHLKIVLQIYFKSY